MSVTAGAAPADAAPGDAAPYPSRGAAWYAAIVLMICYTFAFVDRLILAFLVTPLKHDLHLSDTQIGLLQGLAFAIFYSILGIPAGLAADRVNRRNLIAAGVIAWSLMTSCGSLAKSFGTLALARMGVGIGEATLAPAAFSTLADYFPRERLSSALSVYSMGIQLGVGLALILGGFVAQAVMHMHPVNLPGIGLLEPWRLTFLVVGAPGIFIVALLATLREPPRRMLSRAAGTAPPRAGLASAVAQIRARWHSTVGIALLMACQAMSNYAFGSWCPAFFERVHHWPKSQTGLILGLLTMICGVIGLVSGGRLADHWLRRGIFEAPLRVGLISVLGVLCTLVPAMLLPTAGATVALLVPAVFFLALPIGSSYAAVQMIFPNEVRGTVSAIMLLVLNALGLTLGTLLPGLLDDRLFHDEQMLGASIAITASLATITGAVSASLTIRPYRRDFAAQRS
jgi:MFS family permease